MESPLDNLILDTTLSINDAIAQLGMAFGLDDKGVLSKIPELKKHSAVVSFRHVSGNEYIRMSMVGSGKAVELFSCYIDRNGDVIRK